MCPAVYFDALRLKIRDEGTVRDKAVDLTLGIGVDGRKEVLGLWIEQGEGAKFWLKVFNEWKNRGHFPSDEAASKLLYLTLRNTEKDWRIPPMTWKQAINQFAILFGERFTHGLR